MCFFSVVLTVALKLHKWVSCGQKKMSRRARGQLLTFPTLYMSGFPVAKKECPVGHRLNYLLSQHSLSQQKNCQSHQSQTSPMTCLLVVESLPYFPHHRGSGRRRWRTFQNWGDRRSWTSRRTTCLEDGKSKLVNSKAIFHKIGLINLIASFILKSSKEPYFTSEVPLVEADLPESQRYAHFTPFSPSVLRLRVFKATWS